MYFIIQPKIFNLVTYQCVEFQKLIDNFISLVALQIPLNSSTTTYKNG